MSLELGGVQNYGDTVVGEMYMCVPERSWRMPPAGHKVRSYISTTLNIIFNIILDEQQIDNHLTTTALIWQGIVLSVFSQPSMDEPPSSLLKSRIPKKTILLDHES